MRRKTKSITIAIVSLMLGSMPLAGMAKGQGLQNHPACKSDPKGCYVVLPNQPVKVGSLLALTGAPEFGVPDTNAVLLALEEEGSLGGHALELVSKNDDCNGTPPSLAQSGAQDLVAEGVLAVMGGSCSGSSILANQILGPLGITMLSSTATRTSLTAPGTALDFFLRASNDFVEQRVIADYFKNIRVPAIAEAAIIRDTNSTFSIGAANDFISAYVDSFGGTITNDEAVSCPTTGCVAGDYTAAFSAIDDGTLPGLIHTAPQRASDAGASLTEIKNFENLDAVALLGSGLGSGLSNIAALGGAENAEAFYTSGPPFNPPSFVTKYVNRFGNASECTDQDPDNDVSCEPGSFTGIAYDETKMLLQAAKSVMIKIGAGSDNSILLFPRSALYSALLDVADYQGVMGSYTCSNTPTFNVGDCFNQAAVFQIIGGAFNQVYP